MLGKKILVTGGAGYVGSHTCNLLSQNGFEVTVYDNLSTGHKEFVKWGPLEIGDLLDTNKLSDVIRKYDIDAVFHFAAKAYVGESVQDPFKYYKNNIVGTTSLLEAMQINKVKDIIFSSTCATYGSPPKNKLITEEMPQEPINPYGFTKLIIERMLHDLSMIGKIRYIALRYFNASGASIQANIGEKHNPETHLIPLAIQSHYDEKYTLQVYGNDYDTSDGSAVRDYIHVDDLAEAHLKAYQYLESSNQSDQFNLGTGQGISVLEILKALIELGLSPKFKISSRRKGDPDFLVADNGKAQRILGWNAKKSINEILLSANEWYKKL